MIKLGPMIKFLGCVDANWQLSILVVTDASDPSPSLILSKQAIAVPVKLGELKYTKSTAWRWECKIPLKATPQTINHKVNGINFTVQISAQNKMPTIAYASCNGFSDPKLIKQVTIKNAL